jgi:DNA polymerase-3 subunit gamma/tau
MLHLTVDDIRSLIDQVRIPPQTGKYKVYIIDEVHMLSSAAFNAFLKTLEEPPNMPYLSWQQPRNIK